MVRQLVNRQPVTRQALQRQVFTRRTRTLQTTQQPVTRAEREANVAKQLNIDPTNYDFEFYSNGNIKLVQGKPRQYMTFKNKRTGERKFSTYVPKVYAFSDSGQLLKVLERSVYTSDASKKIRKYQVYTKSLTDYAKNTIRTYRTKSVGSYGRESVRLYYERTPTRERYIQSAIERPYEKKRTEAERIMLRKYGYKLERSAKYLREQEIASERKKRENALFEAQAQLKLQKMLESGKISPSKSGRLAITVGGQRFKFKVDTKARPSVKTAQSKADKTAAQVFNKLNLSPGQKFRITQDGYVFEYKVSSASKPSKAETAIAVLGPGTVELVKPKEGLEGALQSLQKFKTSQLTKIQDSDTGAVEKQVRGIVALGAVGAARGLVNVALAIRHPIKTAMGLVQALRPKNIKTTFKNEVYEFSVDPAGVIAEYYTFGRALGIAGKAAKRSGVGRYVTEEVFIASQPKAIRPAVRAIIKSSKVQEAINPYKIKSIKKVNFFEVKTLTKTEARAVAKALRQTDSVLFGSAAARTLSKSKTPIPKDVDIATSNIKLFSQKFIENLPPKIRKSYVLKGEKVIRKGTKEVLFDVKPLNRLIPERNIFTRRGYIPVSGYVNVLKAPKGSILPRLSKRRFSAATEVPTQKIVKVDGIKMVGFGEQTTRKALGTLQVLIEKNVRRAKDPQSFINALQVQLESLKKSKPKTVLGRLRKKSRIKTLQNALKILTSSKFAKLLEKKVPGLLKEYPILKKINTKKLKKAKKLSKKELKKKLPKKKRTKPVKAEQKKKPKKSLKKKKVKKLKKKTVKKKASRVPSKLKRKRRSSRVPVRRVSKTPSRIPKKKKSSKIPKRKASRLPSKIPKRVSKIPKKRVSKIPKRKISKVPSRVPSKVPGKTPSKVPGKTPSRIPARTPKRPPARKPPTKQEINKETKKTIELAKRRRQFIYIPDLEAKLYGVKVKNKKERALLKKKGRVFSGLEQRGFV